MNRIVFVLTALIVVPPAIASQPQTERPDEAVRCESDADCPRLACGPCDAGTPITRSMRVGPECVVNPCLDASAVCNAQHVCEIGPRTRRNPALWPKR